MAAKKKSQKVSKPKKTAGRKVTAVKHARAKHAAAKKRTARRKTAAKTRHARAIKRSAKPEKAAAFDLHVRESRSGLQSGDLQGVRDVERADSESVEELLEEGNAFEAGIVAGVEQAEDNAETEVRTHEVPEDDVPGEYLDKD